MNIAKKGSPTIINVLKQKITSIIQSRLVTMNFDFYVTKVNVEVERSKSPEYGDYCTNIAITLMKNHDQRIAFASYIAKLLPFRLVKLAEIAPNGFINLFINEKCLSDSIKEVLKQKNDFGNFKKKPDFYNIEFVSANPTGLLHIGHARNAAIGDVLTNI